MLLRVIEQEIKRNKQRKNTPYIVGRIQGYGYTVSFLQDRLDRLHTYEEVRAVASELVESAKPYLQQITSMSKREGAHKSLRNVFRSLKTVSLYPLNEYLPISKELKTVVCILESKYNVKFYGITSADARRFIDRYREQEGGF